MSELNAGLARFFGFYKEGRPRQPLGNLTPDAVYQTAIGGGAMIVDKYPRAMENMNVLIHMMGYF